MIGRPGSFETVHSVFDPKAWRPPYEKTPSSVGNRARNEYEVERTIGVIVEDRRLELTNSIIQSYDTNRETR